jgi:hypothetical protein
MQKHGLQQCIMYINGVITVMLPIAACVLCKHWRLKFTIPLVRCAYLNIRVTVTLSQETGNPNSNIHNNLDLELIGYPMVCSLTDAPTGEVTAVN